VRRERERERERASEIARERERERERDALSPETRGAKWFRVGSGQCNAGNLQEVFHYYLS